MVCNDDFGLQWMYSFKSCEKCDANENSLMHYNCMVRYNSAGCGIELAVTLNNSLPGVALIR